jgi:hypothetical protein
MIFQGARRITDFLAVCGIIVGGSTILFALGIGLGPDSLSSATWKLIATAVGLANLGLSMLVWRSSRQEPSSAKEMPSTRMLRIFTTILGIGGLVVFAIAF